jgi:hypothetical protein
VPVGLKADAVARRGLEEDALDFFI